MKKLTQTTINKMARQLGISDQFVHIGGTLYAKVISVTPELAAQWLAQFNTKNRSLKARTIERYVQDINENRWKLTHQGIAFTCSGILGDGQQRLTAIVQSGKTIEIPIFLGLDNDAPAFIDEGAIRSATDAAKIRGIKDVSKKDIGTVKVAYNGFDYIARPISNNKSLDLEKDWEEGLNFLAEYAPLEKPLAAAGVRGVLLRAYYYYRSNKADLNRLIRFIEILHDGQYGNVEEDKVALLLRDKLMGPVKYFGRQRPLYGIVQKALVSFMERVPVRQLRQASSYEQLQLDYDYEDMPPTRESETMLEPEE